MSSHAGEVMLVAFQDRVRRQMCVYRGALREPTRAATAALQPLDVARYAFTTAPCSGGSHGLCINQNLCAEVLPAKVDRYPDGVPIRWMNALQHDG
ncbi:MAG: hypothetical protein HOI95_09605 [Chromatiales bacterium]|jgi:hypothetical protein|nr:hypothetical protein [Chromatiales bacterium]